MSKKKLFIIVGLVIFLVVILSDIYFLNNNEKISNIDFKDNTINEVASTNTIDNTNTMEIEKQENQDANVIQEETQESKESTEDKISKGTKDNQSVSTKDISSKSSSNNQNTKETNQNNKGSSTSQITTTDTNNNPVSTPTPTPPPTTTSKPETNIKKITQEELTDEIDKYKADIMAIKPGFDYVYAKRGQTFYPYRTSEIEIGVGNVTFGTIYYYVEIFVEGNQEKFRYYIDWEGKK